MSDVAVTVDRESVESIQRSMFRLVAWTNRDAETALLIAAWYVGHAAAAATKLSAKRRKILDNPSYDGSDRRRALFVVQKYRQNHIDLVPVKAKSKSEAAQSKAAQIGMRGLAKNTWWFASAALGAKGDHRTDLLKARAKQVATRSAQAEKHFGGNDQSVTIGSLLGYAGLAFKTKGQKTASNIMQRAADRFKHNVDKKVAWQAKRFGR